MKRGVLLLVIFLLAAGSVFAQNYIVESVSGRVQKESGSNRVNLAAGESLNSETIVHTGVGANLVLRLDDRTFNIPAANSGKISDLVATPSRVSIGGNISRVETGAVARTSGQASTASARASDAAMEDDIAAE
ncbi:MAG: hypothetical protein FWD40_11570 [Treponema sp.]|nr:hypothetical protein [Treponema sp.]